MHNLNSQKLPKWCGRVVCFRKIVMRLLVCNRRLSGWDEWPEISMTWILRTDPIPADLKGEA